MKTEQKSATDWVYLIISLCISLFIFDILFFGPPHQKGLSAAINSIVKLLMLIPLSIISFFLSLYVANKYHDLTSYIVFAISILLPLSVFILPLFIEYNTISIKYFLLSY